MTTQKFYPCSRVELYNFAANYYDWILNVPMSLTSLKVIGSKYFEKRDLTVFGKVLFPGICQIAGS